MRAFAASVLLAASAWAQSQPPLDAFIAQAEAAYPGTPSVTAAATLSGSGISRPVLIDVREPRERAVSVIPGSITPDALARLGPPDDRPIVVYCTIGMRSADWTQRLRADGWVNARNLSGGVLAWAAAGGAFEAPDGRPTRHVHVYGPTWNHLPDGYIATW
jgi:rhodanese-related sulfurtransferase